MQADDNSQNNKKFKDLEDLVNDAREKSKQAPAKPLSASLDIKEKAPKKLPNIRTYQYDAHSAMEKNDASLARMKLAEDKIQKTKPKKKTPTAMWIILIFVFIAGLGVVFYLYIFPNIKLNKPEIETEEKPEALILYNDHITVDIPTRTVTEKIPDEAGGLTYIHINSTSTVRENISSILPNIPSRLARNLENEYMIGFDNERKSGFIILKSQYNFSLAEMRNWERTLSEDYSTLFNSSITYDPLVDKNSNSASIARGNDNINYLVRRDGYIVISQDINTASAIIDLIL